MNFQTYYPALTVLVIIGLLHNIIGIKISAYTEIWWWDILLHLLGGLWVALSSYWFFYTSGFTDIKKTTAYFFAATIPAVLIIGGLWEVFEYVAGLTDVYHGETYKIDTISDIGVDTVGGLIVYLYYRLKYWREF